MWEISIVYKDNKASGSRGRMLHLTDKEFDMLRAEGLLMRKVGEGLDSVVQMVAYDQRAQESLIAQSHLRAENCKTVDQLEAAKFHWWSQYQYYEDALRYSSSCLSDVEARSEALANWQACLARQERIRTGKENF